MVGEVAFEKKKIRNLNFVFTSPLWFVRIRRTEEKNDVAENRIPGLLHYRPDSEYRHF